MPTHPVATTLLTVSQIHPNPDQPRKSFDPEDLKALKESIQERGLINPISVMQRGEGDYLIVAGERRFRAVCDLGWKEIDARVWPSATPREEVELLSLVENVQRKDLTPMEVGNGYKILTQEPYNMSQEQIAKQVGKTQQAVAQYITISQLDTKVQESTIRIVNLGVAHLLQICRLRTPEDATQQASDRCVSAQIALVQEASQKELSVKELKALVDHKLKAAKPKKASRPSFDIFAKVWPELIADTSISACNYWTVEFKKDEWAFKASATKFGSVQDFADWFLQMGKALSAKAEASLSNSDVTPAKPVPGGTPLSDEEEQIQAAREDAKKFGKLGRPV